MRLVTFALCGRDRVGALVEAHVVDLNAACAAALEAKGDAAPANTADRILPADMLAFLSTFWTLEPGDLITTASPMAGPIYPGDVIEAEIEGIGILRNPVESVEADPIYAQRIGL